MQTEGLHIITGVFSGKHRGHKLSNPSSYFISPTQIIAFGICFSSVYEENYIAIFILFSA